MVRHVLIKSILISILVLILVLIGVVANAEHVDFDSRNWSISHWEQWTVEQRESYLAGVRDTAEAVAFQMTRGVGPKETLHSLVKLFIEPREDLYVYMYTRAEPTGSGRIARWISREVLSVMRNKDYLYAPTYLRNSIGRDD